MSLYTSDRTDEMPEQNFQRVKGLPGQRSVSTIGKYVKLKMDVSGKTFEEGLSLHTEITGKGNNIC
ncbi:MULTISPECIES: hypothetical protein [unclassified Pantoea]|uniref:hypothetical protein n=1 Tax=unclassified Pantoea TaxID=2630326 RepID=UPI0028AF090A|nr:hypothetical protein [Pantoea sp.]